MLSTFGGTVKKKRWLSSDYYFAALTPNSMFEMWLYQQLLEQDHGFRWINTGTPSCMLTKKEAI